MAIVLDEHASPPSLTQATLESLRVRHPGESEYTLLRRLVASGGSVPPDIRAQLMRQQREAVSAATGMAKGVYEDDYLPHIRGRWAS